GPRSFSQISHKEEVARCTVNSFSEARHSVNASSAFNSVRRCAAFVISLGSPDSNNAFKRAISDFSSSGDGVNCSFSRKAIDSRIRGSGCPEFAFLANGTIDARATRFDRDERWQIPRAMGKRPRLLSRLPVHRFNEIFDDEPAAAHPSQQLLPSVKVFERAGLAMLACSQHFGQWSRPIIGFTDDV